MRPFVSMALGLALCLAGCDTKPGGGSDKAPAGEPIVIGAIFAMTGPAAFLGAPEAKTVEVLADGINRAGGIDGKPVKLVIKDSGGSPEKAVSLAKQLIDEEKVTAIIGPSTSGESMQIKDICQAAKTPLLSCAAAESIVNPVASYVFKTPQKDSDAAIRIFQTMKEKKISKIGVISSNDGFGAAGKAQIDKLAPASGITVAISEVYDKQETDLTGVLTKLKAQGVEAVLNWSIVPAQGLVAKNMKQLGFDVPLFQSHGFGNIKYAQAGGEAANGIIFPCGRLLVADELPADHPQKALLQAYKKSYEARYKEDASTFGGHAYDAMTLLELALKKGGTSREKLRDALEGLAKVPGTAGIFTMSPTDHNGLTIDAFEMLTVKDGKFTIYKK